MSFYVNIMKCCITNTRGNFHTKETRGLVSQGDLIAKLFKIC